MKAHLFIQNLKFSLTIKSNRLILTFLEITSPSQSLAWLTSCGKSTPIQQSGTPTYFTLKNQDTSEQSTTKGGSNCGGQRRRISGYLYITPKKKPAPNPKGWDTSYRGWPRTWSLSTTRHTRRRPTESDHDTTMLKTLHKIHPPTHSVRTSE